MSAVLLALGAVFYFTSRPEPVAPREPARHFIWQVESLELQHISISLPLEGKSESWAKHADKFWYFDTPNGPKVDMVRWGGGIPLLLSGPGANRRITDQATVEELESYSLVNPRMVISLILEDGETINVTVGDLTLDGKAYYIRLADAPAVYTVDFTWFDVLEKLVLNPPYPESAVSK